ncbi:hypothetical protein O6P43_017243 [Quillaja saponaria]|uniref:Uncharacterized protein n=1 Tax=Quillaja saponaria TaxID=32244 RepID=A0AAD7LPH4_QUISA|nr:hypothetical protein O6P43_017243 [Quillaja saponaria]
MTTHVKPPTPTGSKEFLVMQKQKEEPLGIERLYGGEIVSVELQELGKGHMGMNEGSANKNVNAWMLEESGFTGLVKARVSIEEVKKTKNAHNLIPKRPYNVNWKSGVRNGQEWLGINVIPETPNMMPNVRGCYKDKSEWAKVKYARDYVGKEEIKEEMVCEDFCSPQTDGNKTELFKLVLDSGHDQCVEGSSFYNLKIDEELMVELNIVESTNFKPRMLQLIDKIQTSLLDSPFEETNYMVKLLFPKLTF